VKNHRLSKRKENLKNNTVQPAREKEAQEEKRTAQGSHGKKEKD
jgi:hypothetical protein